MGDEGEGNRQPPSPRLSPRAAPPAAPGSASRYTIAGRDRGVGAPGAPAPGRGGAPLGLFTVGAAGRPPSSAPASGSATARAPARAASRGRRRCLSDVLAAAAAVPPGSCSLRLRGLEASPSPLAPRAQLLTSGRSGEAAGRKECSWGDKPGLGPSLGPSGRTLGGGQEEGTNVSHRPCGGRGPRWG